MNTIRYGYEGLVDGQWSTLHCGEQDASNTFETREEAAAELPNLLAVMGAEEDEVRVCEIPL